MSQGTIKNVDFINPCEGLQKENVMFDHGKNMQPLWTKSQQAFKAYIGIRMGSSCVASIEKNELIVLEMKEPKCTDAEYNSKSDREKEKFKRKEKMYDLYEVKTVENLSKCREMLWNSCTLRLQSRIKSDCDYKESCDAGELWYIIQKICNGSSKTTAENVITNLVEAIFSWFYLIGSDFATLTQFVESFQILRAVAVECGFDIANETLRDKWMNELDNRGASNTKVYQKLNAWKLAAPTAAGARDEEEGRECLSEAFATQVFIKRSGKKYEPFRADQENGYNNGVVNAAVTILEASRRMELYRPPVIMESNENNVNGNTFQQDGVMFTIECFKCGRKGHVLKFCTYNTKEDGSPVNTIDVINKLYKERIEERKAQTTAEELKSKKEEEKTDKKEEEKI